MKPDYKNWIPKGMLFSLIAGTMLSLALLLVFGVFGIGVGGKLRIVLGVVSGIAFVVCAKYTDRCDLHLLNSQPEKAGTPLTVFLPCAVWRVLKRICSSIQDGRLESICVVQPWS